MLSDIRFAFRQMMKAPGFTAVVILTLGLGIGACTAVYSVVDGLLINVIGHDPNPERELRLYETQLPKITDSRISPANYLDWQRLAKCFSYMRAGAPANLTLTGSGEPIRLVAARATHQLIETHGWTLALGRGFLPEEDAPGREKVIIISYQIWQRNLGGDRNVIGQSIQINGEPYTIVGVISEEVGRFSGADAFVPMAFTDAERTQRGTRSLGVWGRLAPGVTFEQAQAEMNVIAAQLAREHPNTNAGWGVSLITTVDIQAGGGLKEALWILMAAVGCVLLIGCANVANLLLARATARQREMAVRLAMGAGRLRLIRQLLTESVLLALLGGATGILLAYWALNVVHGYAGPGMRRLGYVELNFGMLLLALGLSVVTGIVFGLAPAWLTAGVDLNDALKQGTRGSTEGKSRGRLRGVLVAVEIALAIVLMAGSTGLIRRLVDRARQDPGFVSERATVLHVTLPREKYSKPGQLVMFTDAVLSGLRGVTGVQSAGAANSLPVMQQGIRFAIDGRSPLPVSDWPATSYYAVTPDYVQAMGVRLLRGRVFTPRDDAQAPRVAIINETFAKQYFPNEDPLGRRINLAGRGPEVWREIVGIVGDVTQFGAGADTAITAQLYEPFAQNPSPNIQFIVRSTGDPATILTSLKPQVYAVDKDQPVSSVRSLQEILDERVAGQRFAMHLLSVFSGVALVIAAIGIYAVIAYTVSQRATEIGIRMALGAQPRDVLRLVMVYSIRVVGLGLVVGLGAAFAASRTIESMLYQVDARNPVTLAIITLVLASVALVACVLPAFRATRVSPMTALRAE